MNFLSHILRIPVRRALTAASLAAGALMITSCEDSYPIGSSHGTPYGHQTPAAGRVYSNSNYSDRYQYSDHNRSQSYGPGRNRDNHPSAHSSANSNWNRNDDRDYNHDRDSSYRWDRENHQGSRDNNYSSQNNQWNRDNSRYSNGTTWSGGRSYGDRSSSGTWNSR